MFRGLRERFSKAGFVVFRCCVSRLIDLILVKDRNLDFEIEDRIKLILGDPIT